MKRKHIIALIVVTLILSVVVPIIINECYKPNTGYITLWGAPDVLAYFGEILGALGSIFIGIIALAQSEQANKISDRLLQLEEKKNTPFLIIDEDKSKIEAFNSYEVDISIFLKNSTDNVINILGIKDLKMYPSISGGKTFYVPFCSDWTKHYSILPNQSREMNFYLGKNKNEQPIDNFEEYYLEDKFTQIECEFTLSLGYVNSDDKFEQTYEFFLHIPKDLKRNTSARFYSIESSIIKDSNI